MTYQQPPRLMTKEQAASYCGYGTAQFDNKVRAGMFPGPLPGTNRWDRLAIDRKLDKLSNLDSTGNSNDDAKNALERRRARKNGTR